MCDDITELENQGFYEKQVTRREFNLMAGGAAISLAFAGCAPGEAAEGVSEQDVTIETPDGTADAFFAHPSKGAHAAVLIWPDIVGLRPAFKMMAKRLAGDGYAALVVNPYYRQVKGALVEPGQSFRDPGVREKIIPYARALSQTTNRTDARAFVAWLDKQSAVDTSRKIGTTGYCMGGPMTMITAAEIPSRIGAGASFHGGGLATDRENSPHLLIPKMQASYLIAVAENDDKRSPETKTVLKDAFAAADLSAEIEVYEGTQHGWCPPDSAVYNEAMANKAWERKLALFKTALA
ncbi:dienelactone hydrolase family protein [Hellea sp.]|nr:dienelactone hydrolase family protein [Hellea sp.]